MSGSTALAGRVTESISSGMAIVVAPEFYTSRAHQPPAKSALVSEQYPANEVVFWFSKASWPFWSMTLFSVVLAFVLAP